MRNNRTVVVVLLLLLILAVGYILVDMYTEAKEAEQLSTYQSGVRAGYEQAVLTVVQQAATCQQVPLVIGNQTISLVAVECLQRG